MSRYSELAESSRREFEAGVDKKGEYRVPYGGVFICRILSAVPDPEFEHGFRLTINVAGGVTAYVKVFKDELDQLDELDPDEENPAWLVWQCRKTKSKAKTFYARLFPLFTLEQALTISSEHKHLLEPKGHKSPSGDGNVEADGYEIGNGPVSG